MNNKQAWSKEHILHILATPKGSWGKVSHKSIIERMLHKMLLRQTQDERAVRYTKHTNGIGFNKPDAVELTDIAIKSHRTGLSDRELFSVAAKLRKYVRQLVEIAAEYKPSPRVAVQIPAIHPSDSQTVFLDDPNDQNHTYDDFNDRWAQYKNEFAQREIEQDQRAFEAKMDREMRGR